MSKTYLVTGVAGFIGSRLARRLLDDGNQVVGVDNLSLGLKANVDSRIEFLEFDLSAPEALKNLPRVPYESVFHLAGQSGGELSFSETLFDLESNVKSVVNLVDWMQSHGVEKIIHASSVAVYGNVGKDSEKISEENLANPQSPYGVSKLAGEHYVKVLGNYHSMKTASLRLFSVYGPGQDLERLNQGMLSIYLAQALKSNKVLVKGPTDRKRDFTHIDDAVSAFIKVEQSLGLGHEILNVSTGHATSVAHALKILDEELGGDLEFAYLESTPGDVLSWVGDCSKLRRSADWVPEVDFEAGFRTMIQHYVNRPEQHPH